jgi:hypothetical protein
MGRVQLVSIARLRYRPHTRMTAAWFADFNAKAEAFRQWYKQLESRAANSRKEGGR